MLYDPSDVKSHIFDMTLVHDELRTLAQRAEAAIREAILDGEMLPGARLTIDQLAIDLGMSSMPVRDALRQLAATGFVEYAPHRGATVALLSLEDLRDTWDARLALEGTAIRRAAQQFSNADRIAVDSAIARHTAALEDGNGRGARLAHRDIHMGLYAPSTYNWLDLLVGPIWIRSERYRGAALADRGDALQLAGEHRRILEACQAHDPTAAERELYGHLARTANLLGERFAGAPLFDETQPTRIRPAMRAT